MNYAQRQIQRTCTMWWRSIDQTRDLALQTCRQTRLTDPRPADHPAARGGEKKHPLDVKISPETSETELCRHRGGREQASGLQDRLSPSLYLMQPFSVATFQIGMTEVFTLLHHLNPTNALYNKSKALIKALID